MSADTPNSNAANRGPFRPPLILLCSILLGVSLRFAMPRRFAPASLAAPVGVVLVLASIALFIAAVRCFRAAGTPVPGDQPTTMIVRRGPYRFSRNPIYLSFYGLQLGIAFWTNNLWQLVALVATVLLIALVVVPREERYLESRFPATYVPYKESTRRWL
jgi:protein-S-isoprenylcysteine O-methyltransferase Ste14